MTLGMTAQLHALSGPNLGLKVLFKNNNNNNEQRSVLSNLRDSTAAPCISTGRGGELGARKPNSALHCSCTAVTSTPWALQSGAHFWCLTSDPSLRVRYTQPA